MARIRAFRAWRYACSSTDISPLTAPPYDVISDTQRVGYLAQDPHNVVALELPEGSVDPADRENRYEVARKRWREWRESGVLELDARPAVYVLEQRYRLGERTISRKAFIVELGLEPFSAGVVLPHERTLPKALGDRYNLTAATAANFSQVFGLFSDPEHESDHLFAEAMTGAPIASAVDNDGVQSVLWAATDPALADALSALIRDTPVFIADGHHRYTTALAYRDIRRQHAAEDGLAQADPAYDYVLMALVSMDDPNLAVLPTHRVVDAPEALDPETFFARLAQHFIIERLDPEDLDNALAGLARPGYVVQVKGAASPMLVRLRDDVDLDTAITADHGSAWKHLDVAVLQELVLAPLLDIHPDRPETLDRLRFVKDAQEALDASARHDVTFLMRATKIEQLREVALAGETMPQKSTYFYPKLLSGLLFRSAE